MRKSDAARPDEAAHAADSSVAKAEIAGPSRQTPAVDPVAVEPPGPLPSLENLTAESDLTAFLREGVPESLKKAALRKMWLLDPAIRDHVGLADCTWDFNRPGSIPGFGPIGDTAFAPGFFSRPAIAEAAGPEAPVPSAPAPEIAATPVTTAEPDDAAAIQPPDRPAPDARPKPPNSNKTAQRTHGSHGRPPPR